MRRRREVLLRAITVSLLLITIILNGSTCKLTDKSTSESTQIPKDEQTQPPDSEQDGNSTAADNENNDEPTPDDDQTSEPTPNPDDDQTQPSNSGQDGDSIIINHQSTDISSIPLSWINQVKSDLRVLYFHTSHGGQITTGMMNLQLQYGFPYDFNETGEGGALSYQEVWGDLGGQGDLSWEATTREQLNQTGNNANIVIWSWCGGVSHNSEQGIAAYLDAMNQLEIDYPGITFVYMTGHLDGTGEEGNLNIRNNQIRDYCNANEKILYDFADIESYDPDGNYFLDLNANADCNYNSGNWAQEWYKEHGDSNLSYGTSCEHSHVVNCNLKGMAFWWLLARIAGWEGSLI